MSSASKQEPSGVGQSTADHPPMTLLPLDKDEPSLVGAAQSDRALSPPIPPTPHSGHQSTHNRSQSAQKERSECSLSVGSVCVCAVCVMLS